MKNVVSLHIQLNVVLKMLEFVLSMIPFGCVPAGNVRCTVVFGIFHIACHMAEEFLCIIKRYEGARRPAGRIADAGITSVIALITERRWIACMGRLSWGVLSCKLNAKSTSTGAYLLVWSLVR